MEVGEDWLTVEQAAEACGMKPSGIRKAIARGSLPCETVGKHGVSRRMIDPDRLREYRESAKPGRPFAGGSELQKLRDMKSALEAFLGDLRREHEALPVSNHAARYQGFVVRRLATIVEGGEQDDRS